MNSLNPEVNMLHASFCEAVGYEFPLAMSHERWYLAGAAAGITPEGLAMCVRERKRLNAQGGFQRGVLLRNFLRDEEDIANVVEEIAALKARLRIRVVDPAKVSVLEATGRPAAVAETQAVRAGDLELIQRLKEAAK